MTTNNNATKDRSEERVILTTTCPNWLAARIRAAADHDLMTPAAYIRSVLLEHVRQQDSEV